MDKKQFLILLGTLSVFFFIGGFFGTNFYLNHKIDDLFDKTFATNKPANENIKNIMDEQNDEMEDFQKSFFTQNSNPENSGFMFFGNPNTISGTIRTEENEKNYKISVNLKPFNNDIKNVKVKVGKHRVTISAHAKDKHNSSSVYKSFSVSDKLDKNKMTKVQKGSNLIITIPKQIQNY